MVQMRYIPVSISHLYSMPKYYVKNNGVIDLNQMWHNVISNLNDYYQVWFSNKDLIGIARRWFWDWIYSPNDLTVVSLDGLTYLVVDPSNYLLAPFQLRQFTRTITPDLEKDPISPFETDITATTPNQLVASMAYDFNFARSSKIVLCFTYGMLFDALYRDIINGDDSYQKTQLNAIGYKSYNLPLLYAALTPFGASAEHKEYFKTIMDTLKIPSSLYDTIFFSIRFGFRPAETVFPGYSIIEIGTRYVALPIVFGDTPFEPISEFSNVYTWQYIILDVSTLDYNVIVGNPDGSYYFIPKHTTTRLIFVNPKITSDLASAGIDTRYNHVYITDATVGVFAVDDNLQPVSTNGYVLVIHGVSSSPSLAKLNEAYASYRASTMTDMTFGILYYLVNLSLLFIFGWNILGLTFDSLKFLTAVLWELYDSAFAALYSELHTDTVFDA